MIWERMDGVPVKLRCGSSAALCLPCLREVRMSVFLHQTLHCLESPCWSAARPASTLLSSPTRQTQTDRQTERPS